MFTSKSILTPATTLITSCLFFVAFSNTGYAQPATEVRNSVERSIANLNNKYYESFGNQTHLHNGVTYDDRNHLNYDEANRYFLSEDWVEASLVYDNVLYENVFLQYDLVSDKVVLDYPPADKLQLFDQLINSFTISKHRFVLLNGSESQEIKPGFYEVIFDGKIKFYEKHRKTLFKSIESQKVKLTYIDRNQYFMYKDGQYFLIKSSNSFFKAFGKDAKDLKRYASKNGLRPSRKNQEAFVSLIEYYSGMKS